MNEIPSELLIAIEIGRWLRIKCSTVYGWAATGKIPSVKMNGTIRFVRSDIERWIQDRSRMTLDPAPSQRRPILPPQIPSVSRVTIQRAGARAIRQVTKKHQSQQHAQSRLRIPNAEERKNMP
jgi:excisionase family DNA binding protein